MSLAKMTAWDENSARHLLSRTLFGTTREELESALTYSLDELVDDVLLADLPAPLSPGDWINNPPDYKDGKNNRLNFYAMGHWWLELMRTGGLSLREKMVLLWHNHFVSEASVVKIPQYMYKQNALFRTYAFGNVQNLVKHVTRDPAMLIYLDGRRNTKYKPNENYARELMELFTMGIGHYTEQDVAEAARALTGWKVEGLDAVFKENRHDDGLKTFLGQSGHFNDWDIVDIIFQQEATAEWFCRKLYKEFVHYQVDETVVAELAAIMRANHYELKPVLSALLKSEHFFKADFRGAKIKSPVEFIIGALKQFYIDNADEKYIRDALSALQQVLFNPPDVRGWPGQRDWISTNTYPLRNIFTDSIINGRKVDGKKLSFQAPAVSFARRFPHAEEADKFVDEVSAYLCAYPLSDSRKAFLLETLLDGAELYDWSTYDPQAESRLQNFFKTLMRLAEFQLI